MKKKSENPTFLLHITRFFLVLLILSSCQKKEEDPIIKYSHIRLYSNKVIYKNTLFLREHSRSENEVTLSYISDRNIGLADFQFTLTSDHGLTYITYPTFSRKSDTVIISGMKIPILMYDWDMESVADEKSHFFVYDKKVILIHNYSWLIVDRFDFDERTRKINDSIIARIKMAYKLN